MPVLKVIANRNGWITEEVLFGLAKPMLKNQYGQYLIIVIAGMIEGVNSKTLIQD